MEHLPEGDLCPHAFDEASFKVPRHNDKVCHEECAYCCDTTLHPGGIFVCAKCFVGVCPRHIEKHLSLEPTHTTYVRIESTIQYPEKEPTITDATQLGVVPPKEDKVRCYCGECGVHFALSPEFDIAASASAKAIVNADAPTNDAQDAALAAWGLDSPCSCCNDSLKQLPHDKFGPTSENNGKVAPTESEKCNNCECNKNCWFCLTCGNIGCPRKEAGGQEHGIFHYMMTGHPLVLKLGTVTPKRADIHCYKCEREIGYYPELPKHLAHFGIQMSTAVKTAKSLAEMEVDRSLKNEYDSIQEADCVLEPCYGPGTTGLTNFGNTCYIASILQVLNATAPFAKNFGTERGHIAQCKRSQPLNCIECQAERLFVGMASGKYSIPPPAAVSEDDTPAENFREKRTREDRNGIAPKLWKQLVAGNNADWKSKDQQDAEEYFNWVMNMLREVKLNPPLDDNINQGVSNEDSASKSSKQVTHPARVFEFLEETRRSCGACGAARYSYTPYQTLAMHLPVENPPPPLNPDEKLSPEEMEARRVPVEFSQMAASYLKENTYEGTCSHCKAKSTFTNTQKIATFPDFIAIKARREFYDVKLNQVRKMDAKVMMPEKLDLSQFAGTGFQSGKETWLSEEISSSSSRPAAASNHQASSSGVVVDEEQLANLVAMDFDRDKCRWALFKCKNDPEIAIGYIFDHPDEPSESDLRSMEHVPATPPAPAPPTDERDNADNAAASVAVGGKDSPISIPKEKVGTDGAPSNYELYAMVSHMGKNAHSGHWIAHVKDPERGWIIFNDEKVAFSKKTPFTHGSIYFYRRV